MKTCVFCVCVENEDNYNFEFYCSPQICADDFLFNIKLNKNNLLVSIYNTFHNIETFFDVAIIYTKNFSYNWKLFDGNEYPSELF